MLKDDEKIHINDTVLFKQVASVLGKGKALEELTRAYRGYNKYISTMRWDLSCDLVDAFYWGATPQGRDYWEGINNAINK